MLGVVSELAVLFGLLYVFWRRGWFEAMPRLARRFVRHIQEISGAGDPDTFLLRVVQPALVGMIDGTVSTLAPIFAAAVYSGSHAALLVGLATALGAGVSMGWSEALSDTGEQTDRGPSIVRGAITGAATTLGGLFHSLPFLISDVATRPWRWRASSSRASCLRSPVVRSRYLHVPLRKLADRGHDRWSDRGRHRRGDRRQLAAAHLGRMARPAMPSANTAMAKSESGPRRALHRCGRAITPIA